MWARQSLSAGCVYIEVRSPVARDGWEVEASTSRETETRRGAEETRSQGGDRVFTAVRRPRDIACALVAEQAV